MKTFLGQRILTSQKYLVLYAIGKVNTYGGFGTMKIIEKKTKTALKIGVSGGIYDTFYFPYIIYYKSV